MRSCAASHASVRPRRVEMFPKWHITAVRCPSSTSAFGFWRLLTQSRKLRTCGTLRSAPFTSMASISGSRSLPPGFAHSLRLNLEAATQQRHHAFRAINVEREWVAFADLAGGPGNYRFVEAV